MDLDMQSTSCNESSRVEHINKSSNHSALSKNKTFCDEKLCVSEQTVNSVGAEFVQNIKDVACAEVHSSSDKQLSLSYNTIDESSVLQNINTGKCSAVDWEMNSALGNNLSSLCLFMEEQSYANESFVRRSNRLRDKNTQKNDTKKVSESFTQNQGVMRNLYATSTADSNVYDTSGKLDDAAEHQPKYRYKYGKSRRRAKPGQCDSWRHKKSDISRSKSSSRNSCNLIDVEIKGEMETAVHDVHSETLVGQSALGGTSNSVLEQMPAYANTPVSVDGTVDNACRSLHSDSTESSKSSSVDVKKYVEEHVVKPEKVKSRWRRTSELEHGELAASSAVANGHVSSMIASLSDFKGKLSPVPEMKTTPYFKFDIIDESEIQPPSYEHIEKNEYTFERKRCKSKKEIRRMLCDCNLTKDQERGGCKEDCLNRLLMIECGPRCPTGDMCSNKRFQQQKYASAEPFKTEKKGWGLRTLENISKGDFVIEYVGEVLNRRGFDQRIKQYSRKMSDHYYFMSLKCNEVIDAQRKGNLSRFVNHSCNPNCVTEKWTVDGELCVGFFATRDIKAGEELTFDYKFQRYGREAQKCYCGSENCTGYIGGTKPLLAEANNTNSSKNTSKKKISMFKDKEFEEEVEQLHGNGMLHNRDDTLALARLMVLAEDAISRLKLLDVLLSTTEPACLRLFIVYHGLSSLWCWMVNLSDAELKLKILKVLAILPITNKTELLDSKVLNVVHKWSTEKNLCVRNKDQHVQLSTAGNVQLKKQKSSDTSDSETDVNIYTQAQEKSCDTSSISSSSPPKDVTCSELKSNDKSFNHSDYEEKLNAEVISEASRLLNSWESLKEKFRIPRLEKQKRKQDELEADRNVEKVARDVTRSKSEFCHSKSSNRDGFLQRANGSQARREYSGYSSVKTSQGFTSWKAQRKFRNDNRYLPDARLRKTNFPAANKLSKEERRHLFAMEFQQRQVEILDKQREVEALNCNTEVCNYPPHPTSEHCYYDPGPYADYNDADPACVQVPLAAPIVQESNPNIPADDPCSNAASGFLESVPLHVPPPHYVNIPPPVAYPPPLGFQQPPPQLPFLGTSSLSLSHPPPPTAHHSLQPACMPSSASVHTSASILASTNQSVHSVQPPSAPGVASASISIPPQAIALPVASPSYISESIVDGPSNAPIQLSAGFANHISTAPPVSECFRSQQYVGTADQPMYYVHPSISTAAGSEQVVPSDSHYFMSTNIIAPEYISSANRHVKLPPNWKTATDPEGNVYYYHTLTRQTQWEPPEYDETVEEEESTPTEESQNQRKSTTTAAADTSFAVEAAKKIKEAFRARMSGFVVHCLNSYRKPDCTVGRITSTEDFKHLARKLTHFVMAKELKHCKNVEELECNENVKHKAKDFIQKYMSKFGAMYTKEKTSPAE